MRENSEIEEIKKVIKKGFDLELISFELDIPIEKIKQYKSELEVEEKNNSVRTYSARKIIDCENKKIHSKMQQVRERYNKLFFRNNNVENVKQKKLQKQDTELIDSVIVEIEKIIKGMEKLSKKDRRKKAMKIFGELKKIEEYQLTIEQAEKLNQLIQSKELDNLNSKQIYSSEDTRNKKKEKMVKKLVEAIDIEQEKTEDLEELKNLLKKITLEIQVKNPISAGMVKCKIEKKISKIINKKTISRIKNEIPINIESIIVELAKGTLNMQTANEIIEEEARKIVESKPKTRFSLTEEQEKGQILIQIKKVLMERPEQYYIENPEKTINQIQELCGGKLEVSIRTVVKNLTGVKDFERAKEICNKFMKEDKVNFTYIKRLKKEIRNDEISDIVLKVINMKGIDIEEERIYFELIEKGLKMGNIKLEEISLGKSQDGLKFITLADIWEGKKQTQEIR